MIQVPQGKQNLAAPLNNIGQNVDNPLGVVYEEDSGGLRFEVKEMAAKAIL